MKKAWLCLLGLLLFMGLIRLPAVGRGLPYLYDQDEGMHFGYLLRMLQSGDFNPHEFQKPLLLYSRLPITALAFLKAVEKGEIRRLSELKTRNVFLANGFEYTVTHPRLVIYNRLFSVGISLLCIFFLYKLGLLFFSAGESLLAAYLLAVMPTHFVLSSHIGPDMLVTLLALITVYLACKALKENSYRRMLCSAFAAGLSVAAKYNVFLIALCPLLSGFFLLRNKPQDGLFSSSWIGTLLLITSFCFLGFALGAPYSVLAFPEFLNAAAYEVWHYSQAGEAKTNSSQVVFFLRHLSYQEMGLPAFLLSIVACALLLAKDKTRQYTLIVLSFLITYFLYMSKQRMQFVRNLLPVFPFMALFAAKGLSLTVNSLEKLIARLSKSSLPSFALPVLWTCFVFALSGSALVSQISTARHDWLNRRAEDSRTKAAQWIVNNVASDETLAVAGQLALPHYIRNDNRVQQFSADKNYSKKDLLSLWQQGISYVLIPSERSRFEQNEVFAIDGMHGRQVIPQSPAISIVPLGKNYVEFALSELRSRQESKTELANCAQPLVVNREDSAWGEFENSAFEFSGKSYDGYQWIAGRYASINLTNCPSPARKLSFLAYSPWPGQEVSVFVNQELRGTFKPLANSWHEQTLDLGDSKEPTGKLEFVISKTGSLKRLGLSQDKRNLGLAVSQLRVE